MSKLTKTKVAKAILHSAGIISTIAQKCDVDWSTVNNFIKKSPDLQKLLQAEKEGILDLAETQLIKELKLGSAWALKFYLATIGKKRGYVKRSEVTGEDGEKLEVGIIVKPTKREKGFMDPTPGTPRGSSDSDRV